MNEERLRTVFDERWYRACGPSFEGNAIEHYRTVGWREGRDPHPLFSTNFYLAQLPDGLPPQIDPLGHYFSDGLVTGIDPHPLFSTVHYMTRHADELAGLDPLTHYLKHGRADGYDPHPLFDGAQYACHYGDALAGMTPLHHYVVHGADRTLRPHPSFDPNVYARYRQLADDANPLVDFVLRTRELRSQRRPETPECSVVILNFNKGLMTLQSAVNVLCSAADREIEVIVVDNGSAPHDFADMAALMPAAVRIIRLATNRFFGEGNNIGVEASRGRYVLFLNNDAFVSRTTLSELLSVLETQRDAGAAGPKFIYPDGRIQEAGAFVNACGTVTQRGKHLEDRYDRFATVEPVDYISAACLAMRRTDFDAVGGFDLTWEPAYYEDVDICLKLRLLGRKTYYCGTTTVTHIENGTSSDTSLGLRLNNIVEVNREKFISRWSAFLESRDESLSRVKLPPPLDRRQRKNLAVLYTPYSLVPGGGERYLLTIAQHLARTHHTVIVTPVEYSSYRLRMMAHELQLDLAGVELLPENRIAEVAHCDVFFAMGNEMLPQIAPIGKRRIYICQFPFPMHPNHVADAWGRLEKYDAIVVYSEFVAAQLRRRLEATFGQPTLPIVVLPPAVPNYENRFADFRVDGRILNVGRFARAGHCKRQDTLVEAFKLLRDRLPERDLEMHFVGTVAGDAEARDYLLDVRRTAQGYPIYFHLNASPDVLHHLYQSSSLYWHGTGYGVWERYFPERMEHFGISLIEAMSAGTIPMVCANGGPRAIVEDGRTGFHWTSTEELAQKASDALTGDPLRLAHMRSAARAEARRYDTNAFDMRLSALLSEWNVPRESEALLVPAEREVDFFGR